LFITTTTSEGKVTMVPIRTANPNRMSKGPEIDSRKYGAKNSINLKMANNAESVIKTVKPRQKSGLLMIRHKPG
jgi:hypothetical protein